MNENTSAELNPVETTETNEKATEPMMEMQKAPKKKKKGTPKAFVLVILPVILSFVLIASIITLCFAAGTLIALTALHYESVGNYDAAIEIYEFWEMDDADDLRYQQFEDYIYMGDYENALKYLEDELWDHPDYETLKKRFVYLPVSEIATYDDGTTECYFYVYDNYGNCIKETYIDFENNLEYIDYTYDENNNCINVVTVDENGKCVQEFVYDATGLCTSSGEIYDDGYVYTTVYEYDDNGNCVREECREKNGDLFSNTVHSYDGNGNCTYSLITYYDGDVTSYSYRYDMNGNCIDEEIKYYDGDVSKYNYKYDEADNYIGYTQYINGYETFSYTKIIGLYGKPTNGFGYIINDDSEQINFTETIESKLFYFEEASTENLTAQDIL